MSTVIHITGKMEKLQIFIIVNRVRINGSAKIVVYYVIKIMS